MRQLRKEETGDVRACLPHNEEDLLRAAVVFAGSSTSDVGLGARLAEKSITSRDVLCAIQDSHKQIGE